MTFACLHSPTECWRKIELKLSVDSIGIDVVHEALQGLIVSIEANMQDNSDTNVNDSGQAVREEKKILDEWYMLLEVAMQKKEQS